MTTACCQNFYHSSAWLRGSFGARGRDIHSFPLATHQLELDRAKEALTELFNKAKNSNTHIIVERIVNDIDEIVRKVRFPDWQSTSQGERLVQKELRRRC